MAILRRILWTVTIVAWVALFVLTHVPVPRMGHVPVSDKIIHFGAYGVLTLLLMTSLHLGRKNDGRRDWIVLVVLLGYGAIDEWLQIPVRRSCDFQDWLADAAGIASALALFGLIRFTWDFLRRQKPAS